MKTIQLLQKVILKILTQIVDFQREFRQHLKNRYLNESRSEKMSIICNSCGHDNQDDAVFCDECGEELTTNTLSTEEKAMISEESSAEATSDEAEFDHDSSAEATSDEAEFDHDSSAEATNDEAEFDHDSSAEATSDEAEFDEKEEEPPSSLPINAATTLELDEPPIQEMVSPATTLEIPELPQPILINQETEEKIILPSEEKIAYIGRLNDEFTVQVDLSNIERADLISRVHAAIHCENEVYYLEDAGSTNGTWLNEKQIQPGTRFRQELNSGDTIAFGRNQTIKFTFDLED